MSLARPPHHLDRPPVSARHASPRPVVSLALAVDGRNPLVEVAGEVDMSNAHLLVEFVGLLCDGGATRVRLDLSGVTFFSAHGITALLRVRNLVADAGGRLTVLDPAPCVRRLLSLTGVDRAFPADPADRGRSAPAPRRPPDVHPVPG